MVGTVDLDAFVLVFFSGPGHLSGFGAADGDDSGTWDSADEGVDVSFALAAITQEQICKTESEY